MSASHPRVPPCYRATGYVRMSHERRLHFVAPAPAPAAEGPASIELATSASTAGPPAADGRAPQRCRIAAT
jgi:hypothetical protein